MYFLAYLENITQGEIRDLRLALRDSRRLRDKSSPTATDGDPEVELGDRAEHCKTRPALRSVSTCAAQGRLP